MILPITIYSDDILRRKAKPLKGVDAETRELIAHMFESMHNASGIGLAAPQVGRSLRLLVLDVSCLEEYSDVKPMVVINPHLQAVRGFNSMEEGCLSIPGVQGDVERPAAITLKYRDEQFLERSGEFSGMLARVLQHEIDHLDGKLFVDRMEKRELRKIQKKLDLLSSGIVEAKYPVAGHPD
ncbi:MAG: peptide deformylase [Chlorobiaceae bacterium]